MRSKNHSMLKAYFLSRSSRTPSLCYAFALSFLFFPLMLLAYEPNENRLASDEKPLQLQGVGIVEKLGQKVDLDLSFMSEDGQLLPLREFTKGNRPFLLSLVYYNCPNLCNLHLNGVAESLGQIAPKSREFDFVAISIDPNERPSLAKAKKANYIQRFESDHTSNRWHFLTGQNANIQNLAKQVGFNYKWNEKEGEWAHGAAAIVISPDGTISRYLHGVQFAPETVRLSMVEASEGKIGTVIDQIVLMCFMFDPSKNKYTIYAYNLMRLAAVLAVVLLVVFLIPAWRRERRYRQNLGMQS